MRAISASVLLVSVALAVVPACAKGPPKLATDQDKTLYALGQAISKSLDAFQLTPQELEIVKSGIEDGVAGKPSAVDMTQYADKIQELHRTRLAALTQKEKTSGAAYVTKAAAEKGATKTASGIVIKTLTPGTGASPTATDEVKVNYEGKLIDGTVFDSSIERGEPATFPLNGVIPCWTEAVQTMKVGGKSRIVCPSDLAYGDRGSPPQIRPGATLIFEVQLLDIVKPGQEQPAPPK
ncbi:MAG TPA: FKBP-type peptidyl-prolyl cis-trans isomerase [Steroidobacteraceae bacterium]|nr:FKBP-type peptidyl-prolyl cis-trans isomerase [Steroidobacteraceae bacterium]